MRILVTGGTGFVGAALCPMLGAAGHEVAVLTRRADAMKPQGVRHLLTSLEGVDAGRFDAVVNLAGAPLAERRWTESRKKLLAESRIGTTARLVDWMGRAAARPRTLVSASAVGYYGEQGDSPVTEATAPTPGFTHDLCAAWEHEAGKAEALGVRVCAMRIGVVLDRGGGALAQMLPAFRLGLGGPLASGKHYFPWVHREDVASACSWLLESPDARGAYNVSAPNPVTNAEFTRALGRALRRPAVIPMPGLALKALFGELSELLLASDRMLPARLLQAGFRFRYPDLEQALAAIFRKPG